jgi:hypothetical protein
MPPTIHIPLLGECHQDPNFDNWYRSQPIAIPLLDGQVCQIVVENYLEDAHPEEFHQAIANFLAASPAVLTAVEAEFFQYYKDYEAYWEDDGKTPLPSASQVWQHLRFRPHPMISRRFYGDQAVYISLEGGCDWEEAHGLQVVLWQGMKVKKLGPYDGHLSYADAYANPKFESVIYMP